MLHLSGTENGNIQGQVTFTYYDFETSWLEEKQF